jgi:hypothetical protein
MLKPILFIWFALFTALMTTGGAIQAQEMIEAGQIVVGKLNESQYEFHYLFQGEAEAVIIIEMKAVDDFSGLISPVLRLLDAQDQVIADTTGVYRYKEAILTAALPATQTYRIVATLEGGKDATRTGAYTLEFIQAEAITIEEPLIDSISSGSRDHYYAVQTADRFSLLYTKLEGEFAPQISVQRIAENGQLETEMTCYGEAITTAMMGDFVAETPYVITVGEALVDFNFNRVSAQFKLTVINN